MITLPAIGETRSLYGGQIRRNTRCTFIVTLPNGATKRVGHGIEYPQTAWTRAQNLLRAYVGLSALPLPCTKCGAPRASGRGLCRACENAKRQEFRDARANAQKATRRKADGPEIHTLKCRRDRIWADKWILHTFGLKALLRG